MKAAFIPFTSLATSGDTRLVRRAMGVFFAFFLLSPFCTLFDLTNFEIK